MVRILGIPAGNGSIRLYELNRREGPEEDTMYDLIGDIHGYADELTNLLEQLGYEFTGGSYRHPSRKVIFLGDFIDRGPKIRQVLEIVRPMVEGGHALSVLGNHELNALAFHTEDRDAPGVYLRPRTTANIKQHIATLDQLSSEELRSHLDWFRTIPLWLELDGLRAVHACWDEPSMHRIANGCSLHDGLTDDFLHDACRKGARLFEPVEIVLKGKEGKLPSGMSFADKDGHVRTEIRTRWYLEARGRTYRTYALQSNEIDCDLELDESVIAAARPYPEEAKPVFFGHYWLSAPHPAVLAHNVACLDFSVAKDGFLCAYRWNGEKTLKNENFVWSSKTSTNLGKLEIHRKSGQEPFRLENNRLDAKLLEFWQWSSSDLVSNALRGVLAEYIVGLAMGCLDKVREEWDAVDLEWKTEDDRTIRIEVKSAAYLQSWDQKKLSSIIFDIAPKRSWDAKTNVIANEPKRSSDVYVFCLLHHDDKTTVDPLDLSQWSFFAVSTKRIHHEFETQQRISLRTLKNIHGEAFAFADLKPRVLGASNG